MTIRTHSANEDNGRLEVELRSLDKGANDSFSLIDFILGIIAEGGYAGRRKREWVVRIRDLEGYEREVFTVPTLRAAQKSQANTLKASADMPDDQVELWHQHKRWWTFKAA